jgi:uncharacterized membrane protein
MSEGTPPQEPREGEPEGQGGPGAPPPREPWPPPREPWPPPREPWPPPPGDLHPGSPPSPPPPGGYPPPPSGYGQPPGGGYGQPSAGGQPPTGGWGEPPGQGYGQQPPGGWGALPGQGPAGPPRQGGSGLDQNVASGLAYLATILTGIIFLLTDKRPEVRFHSVQSILFGIIWTVVLFLPNWFGIGRLVWIGMFVLWIVLMIQAFQGNHFKLPVLGDLAEQQAAKPM